jgi:hypothetical protein
VCEHVHVTRPRVRWPELRAGIIAIAIGLGLVDGCPLPTPDHTPEARRWIVEPVRGAQRIVETPVRWIRSVLRVSQQWALYQAPTAERFRMWIEGQSADRAWHVLYRAGDADHAEDAAVIEHARVWGVWDPTDAPPAEYQAFARWILARVFARGDYVAARVRMEHVAIGQGEVTPTGEFEWTFVQVRP